MGWFWSSPSSAASSGKPTETTTSSLPPTTEPIATPAPPTPPPPTQSSTASSSGDAEIQKFLEMLQGDDKSKQQPQQPSTSEPSSTAVSTSPSLLSKYKSYIPFSSLFVSDEPTASEPEPPKKTRSPTSLAMSEHCLPVTMSCRDAFDYAWHCQTPGSQFNAVYRYGSMKNCSELWDDFWFCMRTKSFSPEMKAEAVRDYYRKKEEAKYGAGQPSSEDVWESREKRVEWDSEFRAGWEGGVERRKMIREQLGLDREE
ncbi:hypothetical protein B0T20DRAFT_487682 [Sordaria brevicollis]|uniref:Early meiotic induction protein 1 n=1 Tax=Sordaria brevicollis TaxID=83679 RepID=A0AAE0P2K1_SORBR|nr:hypothetical protein B0T20DRAFT_487682 [Sordaria brevicollis]